MDVRVNPWVVKMKLPPDLSCIVGRRDSVENLVELKSLEFRRHRRRRVQQMYVHEHWNASNHAENHQTLTFHRPKHSSFSFQNTHEEEHGYRKATPNARQLLQTATPQTITNRRTIKRPKRRQHGEIIPSNISILDPSPVRRDDRSTQLRPRR